MRVRSHCQLSSRAMLISLTVSFVFMAIRFFVSTRQLAIAIATGHLCDSTP
jgi:hypothetical protein